MKFKTLVCLSGVLLSCWALPVAADQLIAEPKQLTVVNQATLGATVQVVEEEGRVKAVLSALPEGFGQPSATLWSKEDKSDQVTVSAFEKDANGNYVAVLQRDQFGAEVKNFYLQVVLIDATGASQALNPYPFQWSSTQEQPKEAEAEKKEADNRAASNDNSVYRLYHPGLRVHLYTKDANEYKVLGTRGWKQEGEAWKIASQQGEVVYRLYHPDLRIHLYTKDTNEYQVLGTRGWKQEGEAYRSYGNLPIYRLYHPGLKHHLYTKDANEYKVLGTRGWKQEGVAFYGLGQAEVVEPAKPVALTGSLSLTPATNGTLDVSLTNVPATDQLKEVRAAVWSDHNGQDDLKWYPLVKQADGSYRLTVDYKNHKQNIGAYQVHIYYALTDGKTVGITTGKTTLPPVGLAGKISIEGKNNQIGTFDVVVSDVTSPNGIDSVLVPVWSEKNGQDDIQWYTATKQPNGTYRVRVSASNHHYDVGKYQAHLYLKQKNGQMVGVASTVTDVSITQVNPRGTIKIQNVNNTYGLFDVIISDVFAPKGVDQIPVSVWGSPNGQNDLQWYDAVKQPDGTYRVTVRLSRHQYETGTYTAHLYIVSDKQRYDLGTATTRAYYSRKADKAFVDVSSHNGSLSVADYRSLLDKGISGVVVKLTEGTNYQNPYAKEQIQNAKAAGLKVSVYHYSHFTDSQTAKEEAQYFTQFAAQLGLPKTTVMVNDIEEHKTRTNINANMKSWEAEMRHLGYNNLVHYAGASWIDVNDLGRPGPIETGQFGIGNFWVAQYPYRTMSFEQAKEMGLHAGAAAWQYTSAGQLIPGRHLFDVNIDYTGRFTD
ncbi:hypothetical protein GGG87_08095 [Streptococcus sp. zg-86]|uniref:Lysozyme n=1 Tax=Streptococcus zhangguiae TaxID=2664091 RepID=A0A6I4RBU1_9STRE|nr:MULTISPECIES: GBS Bsp-like repeat-containing protein [unclassified Streptococcus]MTB64956.1 hypothetical protein [Streptococcus sp. zg-86]MTB91170.1 hypothetical protein [Streptococcus sp. zg-36]MWV56959.1 hypothetical protein [Streptococcus sp. zg-70]QTH47197.1 GBS Bsp-like repeat-containing protein [Streptococcus sp. zg-86]